MASSGQAQELCSRCGKAKSLLGWLKPFTLDELHH